MLLFEIVVFMIYVANLLWYFISAVKKITISKSKICYSRKNYYLKSKISHENHENYYLKSKSGPWLSG